LLKRPSPTSPIISHPRPAGVILFALFLTLLIVTPARAQDSTTTTVHIVGWGETLWSIAQQYGVSPESVISANNLPDGDHIYAGQRLVIPDSSYTQHTAFPALRSSATHVVQPGETLFSIGQSYGVTVTALSDANGLLNPAQIFAGQELVLPGSPTGGESGYAPAGTASTYVVQPGETLFSIARQYGLSPWVIAQVNDISNPSLLYGGQVLTIPAASALSPTTASPTPASAADRSIIVDVSEQRAYVYQNGGLLWTFVVSTGLPGRDTWRGSFQIQNKIPVAYASTWDLQMPYWLGFYWAGTLQNGFHALPILSDGSRLWGGLLGRPASYGCVILSEADARTLYEWATVGTPVTVRD
jgi:LysM repeat protein